MCCSAGRAAGPGVARARVRPGSRQRVAELRAEQPEVTNPLSSQQPQEQKPCGLRVERATADLLALC